MTQPTTKNPNTTSTKIGITFLATGITSIALSLYTQSQIIAFIGLGTTFWGALFLLIAPTKLTDANLLTSTATPTYQTIDRLITDQKYTAKSYYIPPYPKDVYLPDHLKGLKDTVIFIAAEKDQNLPSIEEIAQGKFQLTNPKGALITPPGMGLLTQFEKKIADTTKITLQELCEILPNIILENFYLAKTITMQTETDKIKLTIHDSLYKDLYNPENKTKSIYLIGDPLTSAIACILAKTTGKTITIQKTKIQPDTLTTETELQIIQS